MGSAGTILVVDDDAGVREALTAALAPRYAVQTAATASAALDSLSAHPFDLILLDHRLPDLAGTTLLQIIKRFFPSTLVILMTGFGSEEVAIEALRGGARDYLRKPIDCRQLYARIEALLAIRLAEPARRHHPYVQPPDLAGPGATPAPAAQTPDRARAIFKALRYVDAHLDSVLSLSVVARAAGMSKFHFCRRFKACTGLHFREYLLRRRIARAKELLKTTGQTITDIFPEVGFKDMSHFGRVFKKLEGQPPSEFRRSLRGRLPRDPADPGRKNLLN